MGGTSRVPLGHVGAMLITHCSIGLTLRPRTRSRQSTGRLRTDGDDAMGATQCDNGFVRVRLAQLIAADAEKAR